MFQASILFREEPQLFKSAASIASFRKKDESSKSSTSLVQAGPESEKVSLSKLLPMPLIASTNLTMMPEKEKPKVLMMQELDPEVSMTTNSTRSLQLPAKEKDVFSNVSDADLKQVKTIYNIVSVIDSYCIVQLSL